MLHSDATFNPAFNAFHPTLKPCNVTASFISRHVARDQPVHNSFQETAKVKAKKPSLHLNDVRRMIAFGVEFGVEFDIEFDMEFDGHERVHINCGCNCKQCVNRAASCANRG